MKQVNQTSSSGIGIGGLLGVLFVALKLTGVIEWSWWWVLSPFWIPLCIVLLVLVVGFLVLGINDYIKRKRKNR